MNDPERIRELEQLTARCWPPREARHVAGWIWRASGGATRRVNSVQTLSFDAGSDLSAAITEVEGLYAEKSQPSCFQLTEATMPSELDRLLEARGYGIVTPTSVMTAYIPSMLLADERTPDLELHTRPTQAVMNALCDPRWDRATRDDRAGIFARIKKPHRYALLTVGGEPAAGGLCVREGNHAGIFSMRTQAPFRGQGMARRVFDRLVGWARSEGCETLYLQVENANEPATRLYARFGLTRSHGYWYRER